MTIPVVKTDKNAVLASAAEEGTLFENVPEDPTTPNHVWVAYRKEGIYASIMRGPSVMPDPWVVFVTRQGLPAKVIHCQYWGVYVAALEDLQDVLSFSSLHTVH